jgi:diguanylate cyclase (GGDEF)-like protein
MENAVKPSIIIIDDIAENVDTLKGMLEIDYTVFVANTGAKALELAVKERPSLILLNVKLAAESGYDVLLTFKDIDATRHIPVIFVTDSGSVDEESNALRLGAVDFISKPFKGEIVRARVYTQVQVVKYIREIERLGMIDALTDIPNRRSFDLTINEEWRRMYRGGTPMSLLMIDVDNFKRYNDTYGHPQGDLLLRHLAQTFIKCLRRPSDTVARLGGEEFAITLPNTDTIGAMNVAESIRASVEAMRVPCKSLGKDTSVTVSIGAATVMPREEHSYVELIEHADSNLYRAKAGGRNRIVV